MEVLNTSIILFKFIFIAMLKTKKFRLILTFVNAIQMDFEPSDSDDEPLDVILKNVQVAEQSYIQWTSNNAACALGKSHHAEMQLNHGIARNKKRQLEQNVQLYKKKRQNSVNSCRNPFLQVVRKTGLT